MSVVYERTFMDPTYSSITHDEAATGDADPTGFQVDPSVGVQDLVGGYNTETLMGPDATDHLDLHSTAVAQTLPSDPMSMAAPQPPTSSPNAASPPKLDVSPSPAPPSRAKIKVKPERDATRNIDGKFQCTWEGCNEEVKTFSRRCEYNKHMDKHDRPYKCMHEGCEKLPGFTYSGGLLRHEREVHNLYGGPKNPLHCPHENCKRHTGKGFSRQENLNEHLRRVHTQSTGSDAGAAPSATADSDGDGDKVSTGHKRKRSTYDDSGPDLADEVRKLREENKELRQQLDAQTNQTVAMMQQIQRLEQTIAAINGRVGVPTADMTL